MFSCDLKHRINIRQHEGRFGIPVHSIFFSSPD